MNRKVLVVSHRPQVTEAVVVSLRHDFVVHRAEGKDDAMVLCRSKGPFAVILADHDLPGDVGLGVLAEMCRAYPDTKRMLLAPRFDHELAVSALRGGSVFRFVPMPPEPDQLHRDVTVAVEEYHRDEEGRLLTEQVQFARESLLTLTETLEHRLAAQIGRLRGIRSFAVGLSECQSLPEVGELTARTISRLLGDRPVEVELEGIEEAHVRAAAGGPLPPELVTQPISTREGCVGRVRLAMGSPTGRRLTENDLECLASITANSAVAAHNQINRHQRDSAQHATIFALAQLAEHRDDETGRHLERVTEYCVLLAKALRDQGKHLTVLTDSFLKDLGLAAPLHDIGKVGVPDSILRKTGKLTDEEWVVMRRHTTIGAETLKSVLETAGEQSFVRMGLDIAWCHHEKWAGGGYPRGLHGSEIPLAARIMSLADCYDALTSRRPYKEPWSHREATNYILEQRGVHFDPDVVDIFQRNEERFDKIRRRLTDEEEADARSSLADVA